MEEYRNSGIAEIVGNTSGRALVESSLCIAATTAHANLAGGSALSNFNLPGRAKATGKGCCAVSTADVSTVTTGERSISGCTGDSTSASSGDESISAGTGGDALSRGNASISATVGAGTVSAAFGERSVAITAGRWGSYCNRRGYAYAGAETAIAAALAQGSMAAGVRGAWLVLCNWRTNQVKALQVDGEAIRENVFYSLSDDGEAVEIETEVEAPTRLDFDWYEK